MKITFDPHNEDDVQLIWRILQSVNAVTDDQAAEPKKKPQTGWDAIIHNSSYMVAKLAVQYFNDQSFTFDELASASGLETRTLIAYWRNLSKTTLGASMLKEQHGSKPKRYAVPTPIAVKIKSLQ